MIPKKPNVIFEQSQWSSAMRVCWPLRNERVNTMIDVHRSEFARPAHMIKRVIFERVSF
jgi:hypothetical protein